MVTHIALRGCACSLDVSSYVENGRSHLGEAQQAQGAKAMILASIIGLLAGRLNYWRLHLRIAVLRRQVAACDAPKMIDR